MPVTSFVWSMIPSQACVVHDYLGSGSSRHIASRTVAHDTIVSVVLAIPRALLELLDI